MKSVRNTLVLFAFFTSLVSLGSVIYKQKYSVTVNNELSTKTESLFSGLVYDEENVISNAFVAISPSQSFFNKMIVLFGLPDDWIEFELLAYKKTLYNKNGAPVLRDATTNSETKVFVGPAVDIFKTTTRGSRVDLELSHRELLASLNKSALDE